MRRFLGFLCVIQFSFGCGPIAEKPVQETTTPIETDSLASLQAHLFINWWIGEQDKQPIALVDRMRNKTLNQLDASELRKYFKKKHLQDSLFGSLEDSIRLMRYHRFEPRQISNPVVWVNHHKLRDYRKLGKHAMWDYLQQDYGKTDYYYLSLPLFSKDSEWAIMSVNYMDGKGKKSHGGGRLFRKISANSWKEIALLTGWGRFE